MFVDNKKLEELIAKYYGAIYAFVSKHISRRQDVEDIVQETFKNAYLHEIKTAPYAFLKQVAINLIRTFYRRQIKQPELLGCDLESLLRDLIDPKKISEQQNLEVYLREKIEMLPRRDKAVIRLRYFTEPPLGYNDIGKILKYSHPTLKKIHDSAIANLRKEIKRYLE